MRRVKLRTLAALLAAVPFVAGCAVDDDVPTTPAVGGALFSRYVALGNSITAGYQSGGLNDSLQVRSYAYMLGQRADASFDAPLIARPGCPRPFLSPLGLAGRLGTSNSCVRISSPRIINNVAVPGEKIGDLLNLPTEPNLLSLHRLLIGNRTQLEAMLAADPTFVSAWIGNNDALAPALGGVPAGMTPAALFAARADSVADVIDSADPMGALLVGVVNPVVTPLLQPGAFYYFAYVGALSQGQPSPFGRPVSADCAPGTPGAQNLVSLAILGTAPTQVPVISCAENAPLVLSTAEQQVVAERVAAYNQAIQTAAAANGRDWLYVNPNAVLVPFLSDPSKIRKCQGFATLTPTSTPQQIGAAIANTCPVLTNPAIGFGSLFSFDGVHPSTEAHVVLANALAPLINAKYGTTLPTS